MKWLILLAISTSLELNSCAGWHDAPPYQAWPAINYLRWTTNVGTYTNESNWQGTNGYGGWTNNMDQFTNYWYTPDYALYLPLDYSTLSYWYLMLQTNASINAKDARLVDCHNATMERAFAVGMSTNNITELYMGSYVDEYPNPSSWLYRNESRDIQEIKTFLLENVISTFVIVAYSNGIPTNTTAVTESNLCAVAGVPTNFFRYTPSRAADTSLSNTYTRIMTNTFVLCQATNTIIGGVATNIPYMATNSLVDSAGIEFEAVGTNGTLVTRIATNVNIQADRSIGDYGFDGLRRVLTNLTATVKTPAWGIGTGTNNSTAYSTNFIASYPELSGFTVPAAGGTPIDWAVVKASNTAVNIRLPYTSAYYDDWDWDFADTLTNPVVFNRTNQASYATADAHFAFSENLYSSHSTEAKQIGGVWCYQYNNQQWASSTFPARSHYRSNVTHWVNYAAPLVYSGARVAERVIYYLPRTNSTEVFWQSNVVSAGVAAHTSTPVRVAQPNLQNFGFITDGYYDFSFFSPDGWFSDISTYLMNPSNGRFYLSSRLYTYGRPIGSSTPYGGPNWQTATTNFPTPVVTAGKVVEVWSFEYR